MGDTKPAAPETQREASTGIEKKTGVAMAAEKCRPLCTGKWVGAGVELDRKKGRSYPLGDGRVV